MQKVGLATIQFEKMEKKAKQLEGQISCHHISAILKMMNVCC